MFEGMNQNVSVVSGFPLILSEKFGENERETGSYDSDFFVALKRILISGLYTQKSKNF